jgi:hypothetical protein
VVGVHVRVHHVGDGHAVLGGEVEVGLGVPGRVEDRGPAPGDPHQVGDAGLRGAQELPGAQLSGQVGHLHGHEQLGPCLGATLHRAHGDSPVGELVGQQLRGIALPADDHGARLRGGGVRVEVFEDLVDRDVPGGHRPDALHGACRELVLVADVEDLGDLPLAQFAEQLRGSDRVCHGEPPVGVGPREPGKINPCCMRIYECSVMSHT